LLQRRTRKKRGKAQKKKGNKSWDLVHTGSENLAGQGKRKKRSLGEEARKKKGEKRGEKQVKSAGTGIHISASRVAGRGRGLSRSQIANRKKFQNRW